MQMSPRRDACLLRGVPCVCSTRSPLNASHMSARPSACRSPARDLPALRVMQLDSNGISGTLWRRWAMQRMRHQAWCMQQSRGI